MKKRTLLLSALAAAVFATSAGALVACGDGVDLQEGGKKPPADTSHTVTFVAGADAKLTKITGNTLKTDKDGHLTATTMPEAEKNQNKENYTFLGWGLKAGATAPTITTTNFKTYVFDADTPVYAVFKEKDTPVVEYDITFANGDHGTVSKTTVKTTNGGYITVAMLPTVTADAGWKHTGWTMDGAAVTFPKAFTSAKTITAVYEEVGNVDEQEYDITFANGDHGTVSATKVTTVDGVITADMLPTVTAEDGWKHTGWEIDGVAATFPKTFTAIATVTAVYEEEGEPPIPEGPVVSVKKGDTEIELYNNSENSVSKYEYMLAGEETTIHLEAGDVLTILIDGESPMPNFNLYNSHGATQNGNKVTINATGDFTFYLRYHEDGKWWNLEINDGETDDLHVGHYYLVGAGFGWTCTAGGYIGETAGEIDLTVEEGTPVAFKVVKCEDESGEIAWDENTVALGYDDVTTGSGYATRDKDGNAVLSTAGTYTVKLVGGKLEITSDVDIPRPTSPEITLTKGTTPITVIDNSASITAPETALYEYKLTTGTIDLNEGDALTLLVDGVSPAPQFGMRPGCHGIEISGNKINVTATGTFTFYLRFYEDNNWWEVEMTDGGSDVLQSGHYYIVGTLSGWKCVASYDLGAEAGGSITKQLAAGTEFKIAGYTATVDKDGDGEPDWNGSLGNYGYGNVTKGIGYVNNAGGNISIKKDGTYTIKFTGSGIEITSSDVEEDTNTPYTAKVTFADGKKVTLTFAMPTNWGLSATELNSCIITINGTKEVNIKSNGSVELDASDIALGGEITIKVAFKQGNATKNGTMKLKLEEGASYMLNWGAPWSGDVFTLTASILG